MKTIGLIVIILFQFAVKANGQDSNEEYAVINSAFFPKNIVVYEESIEIFHLTSEIRFWGSILNDDNNTFLGTDCREVREFINENFVEIARRIHDIPNIDLDRGKLNSRIKITNKSGPEVRKITYPLIVGDYAFVLIFNKSNQSISVQKRVGPAEWIGACNIILYHPPFID